MYYTVCTNSTNLVRIGYPGGRKILKNKNIIFLLMFDILVYTRFKCSHKFLDIRWFSPIYEIGSNKFISSHLVLFIIFTCSTCFDQPWFISVIKIVMKDRHIYYKSNFLFLLWWIMRCLKNVNIKNNNRCIKINI